MSKSLTILSQTEQYVAVDTDAFKIDHEGYIIVNTTATFDHNKAIEFYVSFYFNLQDKNRNT